MPAIVPLEALKPPPRGALPDFVPPPRFGDTRFASYRPQHPSQRDACHRSEAFVATLAAEASAFRWPWQGPAGGRGLYLDGGFGVGKTHLLAAAFHASDLPAKRYLSFQELVYVIGVLGMANAHEEFAEVKLLCIDEFELDDPGNTLIVKSFLQGLFGHGGNVVTTSNTPPEAQGRGRFNADDFQREIQSVAGRFETVSIEGPDFRRRDHLARLLSAEGIEASLADEDAAGVKAVGDWPTFLELLRHTHPIRYRGLFERAGAVYLRGLAPLADQNDALRFVHFIDKLYDLGVGLRASGEVPLADLFHESYRHGAYAKKHERCLSRLTELLEEPLTRPAEELTTPPR